MAFELQDLLDAVKFNVDALALTFRGNAVPCRVAKSPTHREGIEAPVLITVSKGQRPEDVRRFTFKRTRTDWFVDVTLVTPHRGPLAGLDEYGVMRKAITRQFNKLPFAGAGDVFDVAAKPSDYLPPGGQSGEWDYATVEVRLSTVENN